MFLKRIHLKRFGCLHDFTAEFQPGLNVIRGPNESGKSTLHQALLMALMAQPTHNQRTQLWCNWYSDQWYELQLDFTDHAGQLYRITKDFHTNSQAIVRPNDEFVRGRDGVEKAVADTLGTNSMVIVQSTLCVEQDALAAIADGRREISQSLETVLTGSEEKAARSTATCAPDRAPMTKPAAVAGIQATGSAVAFECRNASR